MISSTYFSVTMIVSDHAISDSTPNTCAWLSSIGWLPSKLSRIA